MSYIKEEIRDRVGYIVLNRPEKRNALNAEFITEIKVSISNFRDNKRVKAIIIKSSGDAFCAGADLAYLQQLQKFSYEENYSDSENLATLFKLIYSFPKPIISLVNGPALGGGCGLATICDFCFATPNSTFGYTEVRIGFIPAIVMVFLRKKIGEALSKKLLFTGAIFDAQKAMSYNLITDTLQPELINEYVHNWVVKMIKESSSNSLAMVKEMYNSLDGLNLDEALAYACKMNVAARESEDCKQGISAFLNKEKIHW